MADATLSQSPALVVALVLTVAGVSYAIDWLRERAAPGVVEQQASPTFGPFDDANADLVGVPRKPKSPPTFE